MIEIAQTKTRSCHWWRSSRLRGARGLLDQGMEVTVLHLADWLMEMQLDQSRRNA